MFPRPLPYFKHLRIERNEMRLYGELGQNYVQVQLSTGVVFDLAIVKQLPNLRTIDLGIEPTRNWIAAWDELEYQEQLQAFDELSTEHQTIFLERPTIRKLRKLVEKK